MLSGFASCAYTPPEHQATTFGMDDKERSIEGRLSPTEAVTTLESEAAGPLVYP